MTGGVDRSCDLSDLDLMMSQGVFDCMQWRGMPLFKTVYDFSIYTMLLWALKPRTIIELGSGTGASAVASGASGGPSVSTARFTQSI